MTETADALTLLDPATPDTWPQGILAAADLREQRAKAATREPYVARTSAEDGGAEIAAGPLGMVWLYMGDGEQDIADAEHIAAEANPANALAAVRRWRGVVDRHGDLDHSCVGRIRHRAYQSVDEGQGGSVYTAIPCPDLTETADEARAYLGGAS